MPIQNTLQIHLNSSDAIRQYNDNSYCEFRIPLIEIESNYTIFLSVVHAVIPYSFYNINAFNNTLQYNIGGGSYQIGTIPTGNYTTSTLLAALKIILPMLTITYNQIANKFTFVSGSSNFAFYSTNSTALSILGFTNSNQFSNSYVLVSNSIINLCPVRCLCIHSAFAANGISSNAPYGNDILCSIPVTAAPYSLLHYMGNMNYKINLMTNNLTNLVIRITDQNNMAVNFNYIDWSLTIQLDYEIWTE